MRIKDWEGITDKTMIIRGPNLRKIKKVLNRYKDKLEEQGKTREKVKQLVFKKFKELKNENIKS